MGGLNSRHTRPLLFNDVPHGAQGFIGIHVTEFSSIHHNDFIYLFFGLGYSLNELTL